MAGLTDNETRSIIRWLTELMVANEFAKLGQGGHAKSEVPLRRVFVDLPVTSPREPGRRTLFLSELIGSPASAVKSCFVVEESEAAGLQTSDSPSGISPKRHQPQNARNAILLVGGPGQGKSTLGQLACQLHRVGLLQAYGETLSLRAREVLAAFKESGTQEHPLERLRLPKRPYLPIHVALPELAAWIARQDPSTQAVGVPAILSFITSMPSAVQNGLSASTLLKIGRTLPILLVLDGFDEVGAARDREGIVLAARDFLSSLARIDGAVQLLATTRPQGYAGELERIGVALRQLQLASLEPSEAMQYASRLVRAKIAGVDQQEKTMTKLRDAATSPATARLMTTPLQVTIITALVQHGRAPKERWRLFWSYFDSTYKREIERDTYASGLLAEHRAHIEAIHTRVALILQVEAERVGGATARMSSEQLKGVVEAVLREDHVSPSSDSPGQPDVDTVRADLVADILKAAGERLVFLVEPEPGRFGFEIRSLQEFMAAWALAQGPDVLIRSRMLQISKAPMFRNVLLFVASKLYSETSHLRELLPDSVCTALESDSGISMGRHIAAGALLALEVLEEGAVLNQPRYATSLLTRALPLLDLPPAQEQARLARIIVDDWARTLQTAIDTRIRSVSDVRHAAGAWVCLLEACNNGRAWALELVTKRALSGAEALALMQLSSLAEIRINPVVVDALERAPLDKLDGEQLLRVLVHGPIGAHSIPKDRWLSWLAMSLSMPSTRTRGFVPLSEHAEMPGPTTPKAIPSSWRPILAIAEFCVKPGAMTLSLALDAIAKILSPDDWEAFANYWFWPLAACLRAARTPHELTLISQKVRNGRLGDVRDWRALERGWKSIEGLRVLPGKGGIALWSKTANREAPPLTALRSWFYSDLTRSIKLADASKAFNTESSPIAKEMLADLCLLLARTARPRPSDDALEAWLSASRRSISYLIPRPKWLLRSQWISLLQKFASNEFAWPMTSFVGALRSCIEADFNIVALRVAVAAIARFRRTAVALDPESLEMLRQVISGMSIATPEERAYRAILSVLAGDVRPGDEESVVSAICDYAAERPTVSWWFSEALEVSSVPRTQAASLLALAYQRMPQEFGGRTRLLSMMRNIAQGELSNLHDRDIWFHLGLSEPTPSVVVSVDLSKPVYVRSVALRDVRGVRSLSVTFAPQDPTRGQWAVFLGRNGVGKTTLLRAVAMACRNAQDPSIWPDDTFAVPWTRSGSDEAAIAIATSGGTHETRVRAKGALRVIQQPEQTRRQVFPLFGYGCRRGSALGGKSKEVNLNGDGGPEVATLFSEARDLIHAETWLLILEGDAAKNKRMAAVYQAIKSALLSILELAELEVIDRRVWVTEKTGNSFLFEALSDAHLTTAGWFLDLLARWIELTGRSSSEIRPDFMRDATGLVLIDEIDLHLHPRLQTEMIRRIRDLLPKMSFIVTTHNPLTLVGARAEEIWVLSQSDGETLVRPGTELPMLLTAGQILRQYFDLADIYPEALGRDLQRYAFLVGYPERSPQEERELLELTSKLSEAGILPEWGDASEPTTRRKTKRPRANA